MKKLNALVMALCLSLPLATMAQNGDDDVMSASTFDGLKVRNIGPSYMSGRISDIAVDEQNPSIWYVAVSSGGVWKTINAGTTWTSIFDNEAVYSTGDVTIDPNNSNVIWVGTGENNGGRHIAFGDGVYKSENGGKTWTNMGLGATERIGDIIVHPEDSNTVWVSAQGPLWTSGGERGVYKTTDGGKTWRSTLELDEWTGVASLVADPSNPDKLYAASWSRHRTVGALMNTGPGSALYTSDDGGETWEKMTEGLPKGNMGKVGLAVSPVNINVVYAVIEFDQRAGGFWRSTNKGASWEKMSDQMSGGTGPHYYQEIFADRHTYGRIYMVSAQSYYSDDDGKTWTNTNNRNRHGDDHAFAFHPTDEDFILVGSDGGVYESRDDMGTWRFMQGISVTQFYKIAVDDALPFYNAYGGTQDNSTQGGPSRTKRREGIKNSDWYIIMGADGHQPATVPGNPNIMYAQMQQGGLMRHDKLLRENTSIQPQPAPGDPAERFNWDAPINVSHHDPKRIYHASQRLWRSDNQGDSWTAISGDLTRNGNRLLDPIQGRTWSRESGWDVSAMSNFHTIANVAESPVDENILYVGTDDGLIQVTTDGGANWTRYEIGDISGVPENSYVNDIRADRFDADTVYAALDNHKEGDFAPYLIKSTNRGRSWDLITNGLGDKNLVWRITQDHVNGDLMFLGTEFGLYFTVDGGDQWVELTGNMPTISIRDVRIQRRENDLVAGSFGRGIFILDNYSALRGLNAEALESDALLFAKENNAWYREDTLHSRSQGDDQWAADNPPFGATMTYYLKDKLMTAKDRRVEADKALVEDGQGTTFPDFDVLEAERREAAPALYVTIKDGAGNVVQNVAAANKKGVNRITWNMRHAAQVVITSENSGNNARRPYGAFAVPGGYTATLSSRVDGMVRELAGPVRFNLLDITHRALEGSSDADASAFQRSVADVQAAIAAANTTVGDLMDKLNLYRMAIDRASGGAALEGQFEALRDELYTIDQMINGQSTRVGLGARPASINSRVNFAARSGSGTYGPTPQSTEQLGYAIDAFAGAKSRLVTLTGTTVPALEAAMEAASAPWVRGSDLR